MTKIKRLLVQCLLLTIWSVSCQSINTNTLAPSATPANPPNWWDSWLARPVCQPPCWQNIIPGMTTINQSVSILQSSPEFTAITKSRYGVSWKFKQNEDEGGTLGASQDGIVDVIWLGSVSDKKLPVKAVIASYSYPEYVKPDDCREGMCAALLIFPNLGMFLSVYVENTGTISTPQFEISSTTDVDRVYFFKPGLENFQKLSFQDFDLLMTWKGYGEYP